ncbi:hypothetical protein NDN08_005936 [Rhodosorus marinus]|uniref:FAD-binding PCMH-type domain-containing protein n=1 Tax=Rhodosorus marinus TaxID=101924 RepID=A0AAV8UJD2_9RHOD|nr:hypothetical protein NDN08_005936 [Rhodosorus marinus]
MRFLKRLFCGVGKGGENDGENNGEEEKVDMQEAKVVEHKVEKPSDLAELKGLVQGKVLEKGGEGYEEATHCFNCYDPPKKPLAIVQPVTSSDAQKTVKFARNRNLTVSVAGGRHMFDQSSMSGQVVIDLRLMRKVEVDAQNRTAWVDGGCLAVDVDRATQEHDLAAVNGQYYDTGLGGFTLGGGWGLLSAQHGLSVDNLLEVEFVSADGQLRHISEETNAEQMWLARGAGWNLGVVMRMKLQLHPLESFIVDGKKVHGYGGIMMWVMTPENVDKIAHIMKMYIKAKENGEVAPSYNPTLAFATPPPFEGAPAFVVQQTVFGDPQIGEELTKKYFTDFLEPTMSTCRPEDLVEIQDNHTMLFPPGHRYYMSVRPAMEDGFIGNDKAVDDHVRLMMLKRPREVTSAFVFTGEAVLKVPTENTSCTALREGKMLIIAGCMEPAEGDGPSDNMLTAQKWTRKYFKNEFGPTTQLVYYPNFSLWDEEGKGGPAGYRSATRERIMLLKNNLDPDNVFAHTKMA